MSWEFLDVVGRTADMPLFDARPPAQRHSQTSVDAAASLDEEWLTGRRRLVFDYLRSLPEGATDEQIATGLGMSPNTARPRRVELWKRGFVVEGGTRKTVSGRKATAWRVA